MTRTPRFSLATVVLDCPDAHVLADFYGQLLGWEVTLSEPDWVLLRDPDGGTGLSFQSESDYRPPVWPERPGEQQKMLHLDIRVDDLDEAGAHALAVGATTSRLPTAGRRARLPRPCGAPLLLVHSLGTISPEDGLPSRRRLKRIPAPRVRRFSCLGRAAQRSHSRAPVTPLAHTRRRVAIR